MVRRAGGQADAQAEEIRKRREMLTVLDALISRLVGVKNAGNHVTQEQLSTNIAAAIAEIGRKMREARAADPLDQNLLNQLEVTLNHASSIQAIMQENPGIQLEEDHLRAQRQELVMQLVGLGDRDIPAAPDRAAGEAGSQLQGHEAAHPNRTEVLSEYVKLIRAKEKFRRNGKVSGEKAKDIIARQARITANFRTYVNGLVNGKDQNAKNQLVRELYASITELHMNTAGWLERFQIFLRNPKVALTKGLVLGAIGLGILTGGIASIFALTIMGGALAASRYMGIVGGLDFLHSKIAGKASKGAQGLAVHALHNDNRGIEKRQGKVFTGNIPDNVGNQIDEGFMSASANYRGWKVKKTITAAVLTLVPFIGSIANKFGAGIPSNSFTKWLGVRPGAAADAASHGAAGDAATHAAGGSAGQVHGPHEVYGPPEPTDATLTVPKGGGIWHIAKAALMQRGITDVHSIDQLKDMMVADPGKFGLVENEIIPRAISNGGPWLKLGADAVIPKGILDSIAADAEKLKLAKAAARTVTKGAVHVARAKVAV